MKKIDMSSICGLCQEAMALKEDRGEISHETFARWYDAHCAKCIHESEVCMYGEDDPPVDYELLYALHPELHGVFTEEHEEDYYPDWDAVKEADC